jgi:AcrR family transcriptional regulator
MARPRTDARRRVLDAAERLLTERGYHGFSYQHVADVLQVKAPAIHYHFRRKPDLVVAVLGRYRLGFARFADAQADSTPADRLTAYVALSRTRVVDGRVGALAACAATLAALPADVAEAVLALLADIEAFLVTVVGTPARARAVTSAVLGAQLMGRARGVEAYDTAVAELLAPDRFAGSGVLLALRA